MNIKNVKHLVSVLGGTLWVAFHLNVHQITIHRWIKADKIPAKYKRGLMKLAVEKNLAEKHIDRLITQ